MIAIALLFVRMLCDCFKPRRWLEAEILILRHQLNVLQHHAPRRKLELRWIDRALFIWLYRCCPRILDAIKIVRPETVVRWHRKGISAYWRWKSRPRDRAPKYLIRDNDRAFGAVFRARVRAMGIRDRPTSFRSPWQNGYVERLIGSIRRECTDHLIVFSEEHLRRILAKYSAYYNEVRVHSSLGKDAPCSRSIERFGEIVAYPILGGLHHRYARI